jgi:hypothetical protein
MKKSLFIALALLLMANLSNAQTIYRCNNDPSVTLSPNMFRTLQAAHDAATAGDIIYVEPSFSGQQGTISYGDLLCTKTLKIIGNGNSHQQNTSISQPYFRGESKVGTITIQPSASNTILQSLFSSVASYSYIRAQNVTVLGCLGFGFFLERTAAGANASGAKFLKNYGCGFRFSGYYTNPVSPSCTYTAYQIENLTFKNNRECNFDYLNSTGLLSGGICNVSNSQTLVASIKNVTVTNNYNNVNGGAVDVYGENVVFHSNICNSIILRSNTNIGYYGYSTMTASNNVCTATTCGYGNNNVENVLLSNIFIVPSPSTDEQFRLSPTSPAIGAGLGGIDAGLYGGSDPYRISGLAPIPQITSYSKNASSGVYTTTTPMTVTLNVRGNN